MWAAMLIPAIATLLVLMGLWLDWPILKWLGGTGGRGREPQWDAQDERYIYPPELD